jgi:hypothetical protein
MYTKATLFVVGMTAVATFLLLLALLHSMTCSTSFIHFGYAVYVWIGMIGHDCTKSWKPCKHIIGTPPLQVVAR